MLASTYETDVALIHELWNEYASALMAGDMERWISIWIRGGIEMSAGGLLLTGAEQIRVANRPVMDLFDAEMTISLEEVRILGDCAYSFGSYKQAITPKEGGESISNTGLFLTILEKQADGSWKIAIACFNSSEL
ncbi:MAG: nuclear transport factor 2 family protein [Chloroflexota bacterium]|nr:MAG: nuclear transport factor 2 family protein [Chloroflexota bacterium]